MSCLIPSLSTTVNNIPVFPARQLCSADNIDYKSCVLHGLRNWHTPQREATPSKHRFLIPVRIYVPYTQKVIMTISESL